MDREFLINYEAKEKEKLKKYFEKLQMGWIRENDRYSLGTRLNLGKIYTMLAPVGNLWCQIPLYDTTVIALRPIKDIREFERVHTFDIEDIDRLVDFAKKTNRVQFVLGRSPQLYENMDFLDTVFNEIKPPYLEELGLSGRIDEEKVKLWKDQFKSCVKDTKSLDCIYSHPVYDYYKHFKMSYDQAIEMLSNYFSELRAFALLYDCGEYNEIADMIEREFKTNPMNAFETLYAYALVIRPYRSLIKGEGYIHSERRLFFKRSVRKVRKDGVFTSEIKPEFSYEVGKFLNDKLKIISPKDVEGSIELSDEYELYDCRKVMKALNEAVQKDKIDVINEKSKEIPTIFENVWSDADKLKKKMGNVRHGVSFGIGVIGTIATLPIAGIGGLLSGLGFVFADRIADIKDYGSISEKIVGWRTQSYLMHVYDFKKKYKLFEP
jgi:tetratricopeptide (TPR) repeat protein